MSRGQSNSSITRVWPVFRQLVSRESAAWIPPLLRLASLNPVVRDGLIRALVPLRPDVKETRHYSNGIIAGHGSGGVDLERCFERATPPPAAFLRWLVSHPSRIDWVEKDLGDSTTGEKRRALKGDRGPAEQRKTIDEALEAIETFGAMGSRRQWWALEGFTSIDCCLESDTGLLFVEGKRTDTVNEATSWYVGRNQVVRNLEAAEIQAAGRAFGVVMISEDGRDSVSEEAFVRSLPHLSDAERSRLRRHYLGCMSWRDVCQATGIEHGRLPRTVAQALSD